MIALVIIFLQFIVIDEALRLSTGKQGNAVRLFSKPSEVNSFESSHFPTSYAQYVMKPKPILSKLLILGLLVPTRSKANAINEKPSLEVLSDELTVSVTSPYLGIGLSEVKYRDSYRILINAVKADADLAIKATLREGMILTSVNEVEVEGKTLDEASALLKSAVRPINLIFRDPNLLSKMMKENKPGT